MFTGIIQQVAQIASTDASGDASDGALKIAIKNDFEGVVLGESIAVNGVCLTATQIGSQLDFFIGYETLNRSNLKNLKSGDYVNLERALLASQRLSGHLVQGHVDGEARFLSARSVGESWEIKLELPKPLTKYCVEKGSICLNGVSLTIAALSGSELSIMLIPHTWQHTNLSRLKSGAPVNVEVDVLAKYMEKLCQPYFKQLTT